MPTLILTRLRSNQTVIYNKQKIYIYICTRCSGMLKPKNLMQVMIRHENALKNKQKQKEKKRISYVQKEQITGHTLEQ